MSGDPLDDIMGYLGLGAVSGRADVPTPPPVALAKDDGDVRLIAANGGSSLWMAGNDNAEWIEMRGPFVTLRATRPKAKLLVNVRIDIERWADGGSPQLKARDLTIATASRKGVQVLEITYRTWKPIRLSRDQAKALLKLLDHVKSFAMQG